MHHRSSDIHEDHNHGLGEYIGVTVTQGGLAQLGFWQKLQDNELISRQNWVSQFCRTINRWKTREPWLTMMLSTVHSH